MSCGETVGSGCSAAINFYCPVWVHCDAQVGDTTNSRNFYHLGGDFISTSGAIYLGFGTNKSTLAGGVTYHGNNESHYGNNEFLSPAGPCASTTDFHQQVNFNCNTNFNAGIVTFNTATVFNVFVPFPIGGGMGPQPAPGFALPPIGPMVFPGIPGVGGIAGFIGGGAMLLGRSCADFTLVNSQTQFLCNTYIGNAPGGTPECSGLLEVYHEARFFCESNFYHTTNFSHAVNIAQTGDACECVGGTGATEGDCTTNGGTWECCTDCCFDNDGSHLNPLSVDSSAEFSCNVYIGANVTTAIVAGGAGNAGTLTQTDSGKCKIWDRATDLTADKDQVKLFHCTYPAVLDADVNIGGGSLTAGGDPSLYVEAKSWFHKEASICADFNAYENVIVGTDCGHSLTVESTSTFKCPVTIEGDCGTNALTVEGDSTFKCPVTIEGDCGTNALHVLGDATFMCNVEMGDGACGTTLLVTSDSTFDCPVVIQGSCGTTALTVGGDTALECSVTIGSGNCAGAEQLNSWVESIFHCNVDIGTLATACDPNFTFNSYHDSNFFCDTTFHESVVIGDSCANDTLTVGATSTFNCPATFTDDVTIGNDCGADILTVNAGSIFTCPTEFTDCVEVANLNVGGALSAQSFYFCGQSDACGGDGLGTLLPCPGGGDDDEILLNNGGTLTWHGYTEETISVCIDGVMTPKKFLILD